jgi:hypothetical protein
MKIKRIAGLCALMLFFAANVFSQSITFCSDYTSTGTPIGSSKNWSIKSTGGYVTMVYSQSSNFYLNDNFWIYVDVMTNGSYVPYKTIEVTPSKFYNWFPYSLWMDKPGDFKVVVKSITTDLATAYMNVTQSGGDYTSPSGTTSSANYSGSQVYFCSDVSSTGQPIGADQSFTVNSGGGWVMVLVKNGDGRALNTSSFIVDIYKKKNGEYTFYETKNVTGVLSSSDYDYFKYTFYDSGDYRFSVYNADSKLIQDGYVTVNRN